MDVGTQGYDSNGTLGDLNDLWKFESINCTWISGSNIAAQPSNYETVGVGSPTNSIRARELSAIWMMNGSLRIFGDGQTMPTGSSVTGYFNDLWQYRP